VRVGQAGVPGGRLSPAQERDVTQEPVRAVLRAVGVEGRVVVPEGLAGLLLLVGMALTLDISQVVDWE
jgi:hypothetical protein